MPLRINEFLTSHHRQLKRVATVASIFAWVALGFYTFQALSTLLWAYYQPRLQPWQTPQGEPVVRFLNLAISVIGRLLSGIVDWLLLKGVALGLNMLVETDCNYRSQAQGENHE